MCVLSVMMLMVFLGVSAGLHGQSQQEVRKQCTGNEPGQSIARCSTLIQSGQPESEKPSGICGEGRLVLTKEHA